ncbi:hypothetical protein [Nocardioides yefusunii]|uniref:Uncharacterized protein n=1 Tax=Nocardioides yefusunii TaxID=2500546 RepID=A0ABW1QZU1_9ACTN|nr:hypothetical protein [Nocardioides yefusunii]
MSDKSPRHTMSKKTKSIKEKRAEKRAKAAPATEADRTDPSRKR